MSANIKELFSNQNQSDLMLWLAAAVIGGVGLTWLVISQPWGSSQTLELPPVGISSPATATDDTAASADPAPPERNGSSLDSPLRMAKLAYDAGMLIRIGRDGGVTATVAGARLNGSLVGGKLVIGGVQYTVQRDQDGFRTVQDNDPGNQVVYTRVQ